MQMYSSQMKKWKKQQSSGKAPSYQRAPPATCRYLPATPCFIAAALLVYLLSQPPATLSWSAARKLGTATWRNTRKAFAKFLGAAETDLWELESFVKHFKQQRIKLGMTQADVGSALANLKIPGVGCLSQSNICCFEWLTLSHNNLVALKPILEAWLEELEQAQPKKMAKPTVYPMGNKKHKCMSIAGPEKRSLEAYFAVQPQPLSEKITAIAEKLDLRKNVMRVWFCDHRQKQKRMKFSMAY